MSFWFGLMVLLFLAPGSEGSVNDAQIITTQDPAEGHAGTRRRLGHTGGPATRAQNAVGRSSGRRLERRNVGAAPSTIPAHRAFVGTIERPLPCPFTSMTFAGSGRYILFTLEEVGQLAVFDVSALRVVKIIPLPMPSTLVAGGASTFVMVLPEQKTIQRWNLETLELELTRALPLPGIPVQTGMGCGSEGPLMICTNQEGSRIHFIDLQTLDTIPRLAGIDAKNDIPRAHQVFRFSLDGQTLGVGSREGFVVTLSGAPKSFKHQSVGYVLPGPNGEKIYTMQGIFAPNGVKVVAPPNQIMPIPTTLPEYYLGVERTGYSAQLRLFARGASEAVALLPKTPEVQLPVVLNTIAYMPIEKRVHYVPQADILITTPAEKNRVLARYVDLEAHLKEAGLDYFFVDTIPVKRITRGTRYQYPIHVKSNGRKVRYTLDVAPQGMKISKNGLLSWKVPNDVLGKTQVAVNLLREDGRELIHTFMIEVTR